MSDDRASHRSVPGCQSGARVRIAVNATAVGDRYNGIATTADNLIGSLQMMNHDVLVYSSAKRFRDHGGIVFKETPASLGFGGGFDCKLKTILLAADCFSFVVKSERSSSC